jgi:type I restriction enzyme S subunit
MHGTQTTNLASINRGVLSKLPVPISPVDEQSEILLQIERRLVPASQLDSTLTRQLERAHAARLALLRHAFTGRLVPQDPDDEPASILLERIRKTRQVEAQKPKGKRMSRSKAAVKADGRQDLLTILKTNGGRMTPERLFQAAGFDPSRVDDFYRELTLLRDKLREEKLNSSEARSWPAKAHVFLQLKTGAEK